ncbi:MAG: hypothetical protein IT536_04405 [Hyphomicrobiales bacterium]|nr:hypothetical protein [Hyphomicrobiales bacterium]
MASQKETLIGNLEFMSPINQEGSWGERNLARRTKSTMDLYFYADNTGFIEWDIPKLGMTEHIGLVFEITPDGKRVLVDYDGVFSLPDQAMDLLETHGVDCTEMRATLAD